jgi:unconventional prefoldin RPB5 interactor 1
MFYNNYRSTKAAIREDERRGKLLEKRIINPKERLMNLQKRNKLKNLLTTKFMEKYGIKSNDQEIENEISVFVQKEKLNDVDLKRLDNRIKRILRKNSAKNILKSNLTKNLQQPKSQEELMELQKQNQELNTPPQQENTNINLNNNLNQQNNENICLPQIKQQMQSQGQNQIPDNENKNIKHSQSTSYFNPNNTFTAFPKRRFYKNIKYKSPEEELAELEEELKKDEKEYKPKSIRLDFTKEGDEWNAINKYNKKLFDEQILEERIKDNEMKKRTKADLDNQIKQKIKKEYEDELKEKEYDKIMKEHLKKMDEIEKKKAEDIKKQIMREKINRDILLRAEYVRKRIESLKEKKFERELVKTIKDNLEKDKIALKEKKIRENEALNKAIKENELKNEQLKLKMKKQKEDDILSLEEQIKTEEKQDIERKIYFDRIKSYGNKFILKNAEDIMEKMKEAQKKEDEKMQLYYDKKRIEADEKERKAMIKRREERKELKKYLDMQVEEKKKEEDFLKALDYEQARIWNLDCQKYYEDEKIIDGKIKAMNKKNFDCLMKQINENLNKKTMKKNMSDAEYYMNKDLLEKAKVSLNS